MYLVTLHKRNINRPSVYRENAALIWTVSILFLLGIVYAILVTKTTFRVPCLLQKITGFACPGCGMTHFCTRLLHLDFRGAVRENLAFAIFLPLWVVTLLIHIFWHPKWIGRMERIFWIVTVLGYLLFGVVRNLEGMEFLLPSYLRE